MKNMKIKLERAEPKRNNYEEVEVLRNIYVK